MPPKNASWSKKVAKRGNKRAQSLCFEATESLTNSDELYDVTQKGKVHSKLQKSAKGKKIELPKETPPCSSRRKNPTISPLHTPPSSDTKSSSEEKSSE